MLHGSQFDLELVRPMNFSIPAKFQKRSQTESITQVDSQLSTSQVVSKLPESLSSRNSVDSLRLVEVGQTGG